MGDFKLADVVSQILKADLTQEKKAQIFDELMCHEHYASRKGALEELSIRMSDEGQSYAAAVSNMYDATRDNLEASDGRLARLLEGTGIKR